MEKNGTKKKKDEMLDSHHLCWPRLDWSGTPETKLRRHPYCIVWIPKHTLHREIHAASPSITVPRVTSVLYALDQLDFLKRYEKISQFDTIESRLLLLISLFDYCDRQTANDFRKQLEVVREFYKKAPQ